MDGRGRAIDKVFVEWLWRNMKCKAVYLNSYEDCWEAEANREGIFNFTTTNEFTNHLATAR